jgi:S1-C subfamily serine protease
MFFLTNRFFFPVILVLLLSGVNYSIAGETYKWIDKNGIVHYSDRAPDDQDSELVIIQRNEDTETNETVKPAREKLPLTYINPLEYTTQATFTIKGANTIGTGFFISPNGYAITCKHVIEENGNHIAILHSQEKYPISVISKSNAYDLALILVSTRKRTPYLELRDPFSMKPGDKVYAVGSSAGLQSTITDGLFTGLRKQMPTEKRAVQFSAPVNPGNSGGPLIDKDGKVIGAVSWKLLSNNGLPVTGIGFAVPADYILGEYRGYIKRK